MSWIRSLAQLVAAFAELCAALVRDVAVLAWRRDRVDPWRNPGHPDAQIADRDERAVIRAVPGFIAVPLAFQFHPDIGMLPAILAVAWMSWGARVFARMNGGAMALRMTMASLFVGMLLRWMRCFHDWFAPTPGCYM